MIPAPIATAIRRMRQPGRGPEADALLAAALDGADHHDQHCITTARNLLDAKFPASAAILLEHHAWQPSGEAVGQAEVVGATHVAERGGRPSAAPGTARAQTERNEADA